MKTKSKDFRNLLLKSSLCEIFDVDKDTIYFENC